MAGKKTRLDIAGQRFGKLVVLSFVHADMTPSGHKFSYWLCQCDCGRRTIVRGQNLRSGMTKSCNCGKGNRKNARPSDLLEEKPAGQD